MHVQSCRSCVVTSYEDLIWLHNAGMSTGGKSSRKQRKGSFATPGANGKLLPGEKARLKRARMDAKRAARSAGQGFNAASVVREIEAFVEAAGDIKVDCTHLKLPVHCTIRPSLPVVRVGPKSGCRSSFASMILLLSID